MDSKMKFAQHNLAVPYIVETFVFEDENGQWWRHASHPELADCAVMASTIEEALTKLEARRIAVILKMLEAGDLPPTPRPPI
jgi:predicted RNase H-like HicB family nuclease